MPISAYDKYKKIFKKKGYIKIGGNIKNNELEITNGEIDIHLNLEKINAGFIKLNYNKLKGNSDSFKKFKNELFNYLDKLSSKL